MGKENRYIFDQAIRTADVIVALIGKSCEVAVHDFSNLEKSLIYLAGEITNRKVGSPITDLVLQEIMNSSNKNIQDISNYKTTTKNGKILKSSTVFLKDQESKVIGALCINIDITLLNQITGELQDFISFEQNESKKENFHSSINEVIEEMVNSVIGKFNKIPYQLDMDEKIDVVRELEKLGTFLIKGSTEYLASVLGVSKFTIYNYLQKIRSENEYHFGGNRND